MANDMTTASTGTAVATAGTANAFEAYAQATNKNTIVGDLLKFSKGEYLAGQNADEVAIGTRMVAIMGEMMVGWVKWEGGKPADMRMGRLADSFVPPTRATLGDTDQALWEVDEQTGKPRDPWQLSNYLILKDEKSDKLYTFTTSSKGGMGALGKVAGAYGKNIRMKPDDYPVITLGKDKYKHPNAAYGWIHTPKFDVVGWADRKAVDALLRSEVAEAEKRKEESDDVPF